MLNEATKSNISPGLSPIKPEKVVIGVTDEFNFRLHFAR